MRIGLITDIHSNLQALDAALEFLHQQDVETILCAGDLVCYGANPSDVLQRLQSRHIPAVKGNYDEAVALSLSTASRKPSSPRNEPLKKAALQWTQEVVTEDDREYLRNLPWRSSHRYAGNWVHVLHAGLDYLDEWVAPDAPDSLQRVAATFPGDIVVLGHTHLQFVEEIEGTLLVNPGAIGRSLDGDPRTAFAILNVATREVEFHRVEYAIEQAVAAVDQSSMPNEIGLLIKHAARRIDELEVEAGVKG